MKQILLTILTTVCILTEAIAQAPYAQAKIRPKAAAGAQINTRGGGDVLVTDSDGVESAWTEKQLCLLPRVAPSGLLVGWTTGKVMTTRQQGQVFVNDELCIAKGKVVLAKLKDPLMIEAWTFSADEKYVIVKSRGFHGPATIYRASIATGKTVASHPAHAQKLPVWARPFSDADLPEGDKPREPKVGSPERQAIFDVLRAGVAADQRREDPATHYAPAKFTPLIFQVQGNWAFIDTAMTPDYGERQGVVAVLKKERDKWQIKHLSFADDVTDYEKLAAKLGAPPVLFPRCD